MNIEAQWNMYNNKVFICLEMKRTREKNDDGFYRIMTWLMKWRWNNEKNEAWDNEKKTKHTKNNNDNNINIAFNINKARIITYNVTMVMVVAVVVVVMSLIFIFLYGIHFHNGGVEKEGKTT